MIYKDEYKKATVDVQMTVASLVKRGVWKIQFESGFKRFDTLSRIVPYNGLKINIVFDDWIDFSPETEEVYAKIHDISIERYRVPLNLVFDQDLADYLETTGYNREDWNQRFKQDYPLEQEYFASMEPTEFDGEIVLGDLPAHIQSIILHDLSRICFLPMDIDHEFEFNNYFKSEILYEPEDLRTFHVSGYEYLDNLDFMRKPKDLVHNHYLYEEVAKEMFKKAGWHGDGEITLIWIPPFMFSESDEKKNFMATETYVWHVKQRSDGISYLLSPFKIQNIYNYQ